MIAASSLNDSSSGPSTGRSPVPLHDRSVSRRAATAAMSLVAV